MTLTIKYFGRLQELTAKAEEQLDVSVKTVAELRKAVAARYPELADASFTIAVDQQLASEDKILNQDAEVAFLPPFSGG